MALIGTIRKNFWFVLILLGMALAAFILMDMKGSNNGMSAQRTMGEIAGQKIDYADFNRAEEALYSGNPDVYSRRDALWNYFKEKAVVDNEADALGLAVTRDELMDLQFGNRLSPVIQNNFRNRQTGQVDRSTLLQYKQMIENGEELPAKFRSFWAEQEKQIIKSELQSKMGNLVSKGMYTPTFLVEETAAANSGKVELAYVKIPFDEIDANVEVSDADITAYINDHKADYTSEEETRVLQYAVVDVLPTASDSASWLTEISGLIPNFKSTDNDSAFAVNRNGMYSSVYFSNDALPEVLQGKLDAVSVGDTYGPYVDQGAYIVTKVLDKRVMPDSVEAKHILRRITTGTPEDYAAADAYADSLLNLYNRGTKFETLAEENSQDPSSSAKGGDLGTMAQGQGYASLPVFRNAIFNGSENRVYKVKSPAGVHLVKVEDQIYNDRNDKFQVATIATPIIPTETTQNAINDKLTDLITDNRDFASLESAMTGMGYNFETSAPLKANDYRIGALGTDNSSREMVRWAYETDVNVGEVSPTVYSYSDKVNYYDNKYVVAALKNIQPAGTYTAESMRSTLENVVANKKKAESILSGLSTDLSAVASQYGVKVDTARNVSMSSSFVPGIGTENEVIAKAFATDTNGTAKIVGTSGVFVISPVAKTEGTVGNVLSQKQLRTRAARNQAELKTIEALKKNAKVDDKRATFF